MLPPNDHPRRRTCRRKEPLAPSRPDAKAGPRPSPPARRGSWLRTRGRSCLESPSQSRAKAPSPRSKKLDLGNPPSRSPFFPPGAGPFPPCPRRSHDTRDRPVQRHTTPGPGAAQDHRGSRERNSTCIVIESRGTEQGTNINDSRPLFWAANRGQTDPSMICIRESAGLHCADDLRAVPNDPFDPAGSGSLHMKNLDVSIFGMAILMFIPISVRGEGDDSKTNKSVVKIFANQHSPDHLQAMGQGLGSGSDRIGSSDHREADLDKRPCRQPTPARSSSSSTSRAKSSPASVVALDARHRPGGTQARRRVGVRRPSRTASQLKAPRPPAGRLRVWLSARGIGTLDHAGNRLADRIRRLLYGSRRATNPDRRRDQPRKQRGPGRGGRAIDRHCLQQAR